MPKSPKHEILQESLGDVEIKPSTRKDLNDKITSVEIQQIQAKATEDLSRCKTHREMLELQVTSLSECIGVATGIYKSNPVTDNAYQLSALTNAHRSALGQLEKMKDPQQILADIEVHIKTMFMDIVKAMALEMDRSKRELMLIAPDEKPTVDDIFHRMTNAIQPETQNIYNDLRNSLMKILGIRA